MRIGCVSWQGLGLFEPSHPSPFGGAEVRAMTFARGLAALEDVDVTFLVGGPGEGRDETRGGLRLRVVAYPPKARGLRQRLLLPITEAVERVPGFPWVRIRRFRPDLLWRLPALAAGYLPGFEKISTLPRPDLSFDPTPYDVVLCFGVNDRSAGVVAACRRHGVPCVLSVACDHDLSAEYFRGSTHRGPYGESGHLGYLALSRASAVMVQTEEQRELLERRIGREGVLIRNPIDLETLAPERPGGPFALWVGRADSVQKRPDLCLELARGAPEIPFLMIMNRGMEQGLFEKLEASAPENVEIVERVSFTEVEGYFRTARVFINTSVLEGFPNTFLQAAKYEVPILSWQADPDGFLTQEGCGIVAEGEMGAMTGGLEGLWYDDGKNLEMGRAARAYAERYHALEARASELAALLESLTSTG